MTATIPAPAPTPGARRAAVLDFITNHIREKGYAPSIKEIGTTCGIRSNATVKYHLDLLEAAGLIRRGRAHTNRAITLPAPAGCCPTCGQAVKP